MKMSLFVLFILLTSIALQLNTTKLQKKGFEEPNLSFNQNDSKALAKTLIELECANKPLKKTCPNCLKPTDGSTFIHFYSLKRHRKFEYKYLVRFNDEKQIIDVFFTGPVFKKENYKYFGKYFRNKIPSVTVDGFKINSELYHLYEKYFKKRLYETLDKLVKSKRDGFSLVFAGSSIGGSLATFAAYDVSHNYKNNPFKNKMHVYAFNALVVADEKFAIAITETKTVVHRIYKDDDFIVYPSCKFNSVKQTWTCKESKVIFIVAKKKNSSRKQLRKAGKSKAKTVAKRTKKDKKNKSNQDKKKKNGKVAKRKNNNKEKKTKKKPQSKKKDEKKKTDKKVSKKKNEKKAERKSSDKKVTKKDKKSDKKKTNKKEAGKKKADKKKSSKTKSHKIAKKKSLPKKNNKKAARKSSTKGKLSKPKRTNGKSKALVLNDETNKSKVAKKKSGFAPAPIPKAEKKSISFRTGLYGEIILYDGDMNNYKVCKMIPDKSGKITECVIDITPSTIITSYSHLILYKMTVGVCK